MTKSITIIKCSFIGDTSTVIQFERDVQEMVEKDIPLTPDLLCEHYGKMNKNYFGPKMVIDKEIELEWARIPHFYYNFYVYKYATGFAAAQIFARRVRESDEQRQLYLDFLKSGSNRDPLDTVQAAGVDLSQPSVIKDSFVIFREQTRELAGL